MFTFSDLSLNPLKTFILIVLGAFWVYQTLLDMVITIVSNSHLGEGSAAREITTCVSHVVSESVNPY